jgi:hypothetical protein
MELLLAVSTFEHGGTAMHNDVTGNDEAITAEAIVIAVNHRGKSSAA